VDAAENALIEAGALAVTLCDAGDAPVLEPGPGETPLWPAVRVTGLFPGSGDALALVARLAAALPGTQWHVQGLGERAWEREWLKDFRPRRFGTRLWVAPLDVTAPEDGVVLRLDPGLAFGTGHHDTTALCLEWLDGLAGGDRLAGAVVVDYGCGSGILAIAALKLGAARAVAVDNDPQALAATTANAARNGVGERLTACAPEGLDAALGGRPADVLVANILAGPLVELAPRFAAALGRGGRIALSGILAGQEARVLSACAPDFEMDAPCTREEWIRLQGTRT
jgi:ribosomal protein L11 methyltransferase